MTSLITDVTAIEAEMRKLDAARPKQWHQVVQQVGQTWDEALDAYGRDRIGPDDGIIQRELVRPQFDAQGRIIPRRA